MRVLHVLGELRHSGAETMLAAAGPAFEARGVESEIMSTGAVVGALGPQLESAGYRIHHVPFRKSPAFFRAVRRVMHDGRYDVIHLHTERANFWFGVVAVGARPGLVIRTIHNVFSFEGALRGRRGLQRRVLHRLGVVHVACSASIQQNERARFRLETRLLPNWYDSRRFFAASERERLEARRALRLSVDQFALVSVGNCSEVKNHASLITALSRLAGSEQLVYIHAGAEEPNRPEHALARELGVLDHMQFVGSVDDVPTLFAASDLFAMPSLYEGFPIAALEALASGLPVLLADAPGLRDFRELYPDLEYVEPTSDSIADTLGRLVRMPVDRLRATAAANAEITLEHFGLDAGVDRYVRLYETAS